jgi:hypothetical protein
MIYLEALRDRADKKLIRKTMRENISPALNADLSVPRGTGGQPPNPAWRSEPAILNHDPFADVCLGGAQ